MNIKVVVLHALHQLSNTALLLINRLRNTKLLTGA